MKTFLSSCSAFCLLTMTLAPAVPALAQKGKKPARCVDDIFPATLEVLAHPEAGGPAIFPSVGDRLLATLTSGNIASSVEAADGGGVILTDLPVHLDLTNGDSHYETFHPGTDNQIDVDPFVSTLVHTNDADFDVVECQMFGMAVGESYRMRLTFQWFELEGEPVTRESDSDQRWVLRYKPVTIPDEQQTWLDAVRITSDVWELTSRADSDPAHFASLERDGSGRGKNKTPTTYSKPEMPVQVRITVDCGGPCPVPNP